MDNKSNTDDKEFTRDDFIKIIDEHKPTNNFDLFKNILTSIYDLAEKNRINPGDSQKEINEKNNNDAIIKTSLKLMELKATMGSITLSPNLDSRSDKTNEQVMQETLVGMNEHSFLAKSPSITPKYAPCEIRLEKNE
jgi:hypothetical protein